MKARPHQDALVRQAYSPVRWIETVQEIARRGATHVFECGPGKGALAGADQAREGSLGGAIADAVSLEETLKTTGSMGQVHRRSGRAGDRCIPRHWPRRI